MSYEEDDVIGFYLEKIALTTGYRKDFSGAGMTSRRPDRSSESCSGKNYRQNLENEPVELSDGFDGRDVKREASRMVLSFLHDHSG